MNCQHQGRGEWWITLWGRGGGDDSDAVVDEWMFGDDCDGCHTLNCILVDLARPARSAGRDNSVDTTRSEERRSTTLLPWCGKLRQSGIVDLPPMRKNTKPQHSPRRSRWEAISYSLTPPLHPPSGATREAISLARLRARGGWQRRSGIIGYPPRREHTKPHHSPRPSRWEAISCSHALPLHPPSSTTRGAFSLARLRAAGGWYGQTDGRTGDGEASDSGNAAVNAAVCAIAIAVHLAVLLAAQAAATAAIALRRCGIRERGRMQTSPTTTVDLLCRRGLCEARMVGGRRIRQRKPTGNPADRIRARSRRAEAWFFIYLTI